MELGLTDHYVLVTGSSRGIGLSIAERFLQEDANVILTGRNENTLTEAHKTLSAKYRKRQVVCFAGDLQRKEVMLKLRDVVNETIGALNHLVCNIGSGRSVAPLTEDIDEIQRMLSINCLSSALGVQIMLPLLMENGSLARTSTITLIGSICGVAALGCPVGYAVAKSALETYARNIARPLGGKGIRVNIVSAGNIVFPGSVWETKLHEDAEAVKEMLTREVPLRRFGRPEEIASAVVFLASKEAAFVTGANWVVDGGQLR